jgi:starch-binding outer membrane protein, SusD/RagB family
MQLFSLNVKNYQMKQIIYILIACGSFSLGCKKYLEEKSDQRLATPDTIEDLQALLDGPGLRRAMAETNTGSDEYYLDPIFWGGLPDRYKESYVWNARDDYGYNSYDWTYQYKSIFNVNAVLDNLERVSPEGQVEKWNNLKGAALFIRAHCFYQLAQVYAKQYDPNTAGSDMGICLRLSSDFNKSSVRSSVQETYDQIIKDLQEAVPLLPEVSQFRTRPGRPAAFALLSRTYLIMGNFAKAKEFADNCLNLYSTLVDFNNLDSSSLHPIPPLNEEVLYYTETNDPLNVLTHPLVMVDSSLAKSYVANDLRRVIYLVKDSDTTSSYKTISNNGDFLYNGISVDEVLLTRAECYARLGNVSTAIQDLNNLLEKRWKAATFIPYTASNTTDALNLILAERQKELLNRGTRWSDIRRLNMDAISATSLKRVIGTDQYTLIPHDKRFVWLIPQEVIQISGIKQNPR